MSSQLKVRRSTTVDVPITFPNQVRAVDGTMVMTLREDGFVYISGIKKEQFVVRKEFLHEAVLILIGQPLLPSPAAEAFSVADVPVSQEAQRHG
jgi:hypothetical protein